VPSVFEAVPIPAHYAGLVREYRVRFRGPETPSGFRWLLTFESVRRSATVYLNGRRLGRNSDPYTPFTYEAQGLRPGAANTLRVVVDSRKDPRIAEGWWNWGGIVRPVHLVPAGRAHLSDLGTMSRVRCRGAATRCRAELLIDATMKRLGPPRTIRPRLEVLLRSPAGHTTRHSFSLPAQRHEARRVRLSLPVPRPVLWKPEDPRLYSARILLRDGGRLEQVERRAVGLRSVEVKRGRLYVNNREVQLSGASIHEDMPGSGAALTDADMDRIVADLQEMGANVTRSHYVLREELLDRLDRAGIMVWNQAPIWQRDRGRNVLQYAYQRRRAYGTVRRTVIAARSHPSVITHSVANELRSRPDEAWVTRNYLTKAQALARDLDPTLPISVDINGRPGHPEQFTYHHFDMLGINQYFGWYSWVENFDDLPLFLQEMRDNYPQLALVMTEFGAEARPELADAPADVKGSYAFQSFHAARTLEVADRAPFSGAIYWTVREFEIFPGWTGGAGRRPPPYHPNTRHQKGLLTYEGEKKPAWYVVRDFFASTPLYR
jgi:beta-galactosidase/beta-glucuronidase